MTGELSSEPVRLTVEPFAQGSRVDQYLARHFPDYSRSLLQKGIEQHAVLVNGSPVKASRRLQAADVLSVRLPREAERALPAEDIPLKIVFEDEALVVLDKPAGMITHPGRGNYGGTLASALQFHFDRLSDVGGTLRPGIVHRLDRDTSGLLVVAKDNQVHHRLSAQFERREVTKEYRAIAWGVIARDADTIETHVRVNPQAREKMIVCEAGGKARLATTHYEVLERFYDFTYVRLLPRTGRTHQLRVHLRHLGHPIVADRLYGGRAALAASYLDPAGPTRRDSRRPPELREGDEVLLARQALHAFRLAFRHPVSGAPLEFEAPLPADMENTLRALRKTASPDIL